MFRNTWYSASQIVAFFFHLASQIPEEFPGIAGRSQGIVP
jgi:hypothetical protein